MITNLALIGGTREYDNVSLIKTNSVHSSIHTFLNQKRKKSENTYKNYKNWITEVLNIIFDKNISTLTWDDIKSVNYDQFCQVQEILETKNGNNTVNQKMACVASLWRSFKRYINDLNIEVVKVPQLTIIVNPHGSLSEGEIKQLLEFCKSRDYKPNIQEIFFKTCFITGIRSNNLMNLTIDKVQQITDTITNKLVWCICVKDKGKDITKAIPDSLYDEFLYCISNEPQLTKKIFNICDKKLRTTLNDFCIINNIGDDRKICLHSLKKASMDYVWNTTKDIVKTAKQGQHTGFETTYRTYLGTNSSLTEQPSYDLFDKDYNISQLAGLTKDELLDLIDSCDKNIMKQLIYALVNK